MKLTKDIMNKFTSAFSVPLQLYAKGKLIYACQKASFNPDPAYHFLRPYVGGEHSVCFVVSPDYILSGYIALPDSVEYLIIGPVIPYDLSIRQAERLIKELGISKSLLDDLLCYFHFIPHMSSTSFQYMLDLINTLLRPKSHEDPIQLSYQEQHFDSQDSKGSYFDTKKNEDSEIVLHKLISHGRVDEINEYFDKISTMKNLFMPNHASNPIRSLKNTVIASAGLTARHAIEGGLDYQTATSLSEYYISKIESKSNYTEILELFRTMTLDFTKRVSLINRLDSDSPTINAIFQDVQKHLYKKITTDNISKHLSLSNSYICQHFKKKTGMTLTEYIHKQKIREAKYLLDTSDLSLVTISVQLGFSSQQHFQSIFKNVTGLTPNQYRKGRSRD